MDVVGFLLFLSAIAGIVVLTLLKGRAWKDFTDRVTDKNE
mgnify:CR=1 FL=1